MSPAKTDGDPVADYGLEPFLRQWLESPEEPELPFCREVYGDTPAIDPDRDYLEKALRSDLLQIERGFLDGDVRDLEFHIGQLPLRGRSEVDDPVDWWAPGVYIHGLRRLVEGDSPELVYEDLRRVERELSMPVPYVERLRMRVGEALRRDQGHAPAPEADPRGDSPATRAFPAWPSRDSWLLVGDRVTAEDGFLAFGGRRGGSLTPQVFKLLYHLRGKRARLGLEDALENRLIQPKERANALRTFKMLIQRACNAFYELGATRDERPLQQLGNECHSVIEIVHRRRTPAIR